MSYGGSLHREGIQTILKMIYFIPASKLSKSRSHFQNCPGDALGRWRRVSRSPSWNKLTFVTQTSSLVGKIG